MKFHKVIGSEIDLNVTFMELRRDIEMRILRNDIFQEIRKGYYDFR